MTTSDPGYGPTELLTPTGGAALVTLRRDGRPQLSNIDYAYDRATGVVRISATDDRAKVRNLRRDPRATLYLTSTDQRSYLVVDGTASLTPPAADPQDATVEALIDLYKAVQGEHPDWADYRAAMVGDRRLVITVTVERTYGWARDR
jgi:PPOX class probable F420-dependent enzyme